MKRIVGHLGCFGASQNGAAAVEFALWLGVSLWPLLNVIDVGFYAFDRTQVENSAQMAVQSISTACGQVVTAPVLTTCNTVLGYNVANMMTARAQSTSLGTQVTVSSRYECSGSTVTVNSAGGTDPTCPTSSGDYIGAKVTYTYTPLFAGITATSLLGTTITRTYWMRVI
jgi:Flp pilus assembly protein TadG